MCVLYKDSNIVQRETLSDGISGDMTLSSSLTFDIGVDVTSIGFYIENISGTGNATYRVDSFAGSGAVSIKYYFINQLIRMDKHNMYQAELIQLFT